ncbi:unnamed protein product [Chilo suppressalis]|uniref:Uncharacterized protein n=1 Tax=Chilo suppressalis TaxID=168631 RepID=A0ABN8EA95_CHISP|nr:unnamed protein product [Chilo suppressalis]
MENEEQERKKLNDDMVVFLRKRSETETPRYAARLHAYVDVQRKRNRAAAAKRRSEHGHERKISANKKKGEIEQKDKNAENSASRLNAARRSNCGLVGEHPGAEDDRMSRRRGGDKNGMGRTRSFSRSRSAEPSDRCGRRRRRRRSCSRRRRRRRSCRRRRRRSCRRRPRRRRRSCSRRRRRRSCRRRRRRCR